MYMCMCFILGVQDLYLTIYLSIHLSIYLTIYLSFYLSIYLYIYYPSIISSISGVQGQYPLLLWPRYPCGPCPGRGPRQRGRGPAPVLHPGGEQGGTLQGGPWDRGSQCRQGPAGYQRYVFLGTFMDFQGLLGLLDTLRDFQRQFLEFSYFLISVEPFLSIFQDCFGGIFCPFRRFWRLFAKDFRVLSFQ